MRWLLNEIEMAIEHKLLFIALQTALAIPDICGAIESEDGISRKTQYFAWYDEYAKPKLNCWMSARDCYYFRCSMLHQGSTIPSPPPGTKEENKPSYSRIVFVCPYGGNIKMHNCALDDMLAVDVSIFCRGLVEAAQQWIEKMENEKNANYIKNTNRIIRYYPQGIGPYFNNVGMIG